MVSDTVQVSSPDHPQPGVLPAAPRVWPAVALVLAYWTARLIEGLVGGPMFTRFLFELAACALLTLLFLAWWFLRRRVGWGERLLILAAAVAGGALATWLTVPAAGMVPWFLMTLPWLFTVWAAWLLLARRASARTRQLGLLTALLLTWGGFSLVRMDGLTGEGQMVLHWRWTPTAEDLYLRELARKGESGEKTRAVGAPPHALSLQPGDWPGFRGPDRDGAARGVRAATDWSAAPPRLLWRRRVGPAWSSVALVADRLFTQEQRGEKEAVVCLDAADGREVWAHEDAARFWDGQAGLGPRATPTFANGRVYALGATGILNCLDAATGERRWSRDIAADAGAKAPIWGFASSPLVVNGVVIVFAGEGGKGLLAYDADSGEPAWTADVGKMSYASPQRASVGGQEQVLFVSDGGLTATDPANGALLWKYDLRSAPGLPWSVQPHPVGGGAVLIGSEGQGTALIDVKRDGGTWAVTQRWASRRLKPSFNDFVVYDGFVYGFDQDVFCCIELETGKGRWREGRYGHGQVVLLADQGLLLVVTESGEAVLVPASPDRHEELGRFQAINGKTWNHPAVVRGRLFVRNAEEMACYDLGVSPAP